jgi:hypothetical protein
MTDRRVEYVPLDEIRQAPRNPKNHDTSGIAASIGRFGIAALPIIDERTNQLVVGHGRLVDIITRRDQGEQPPDGVLVDDDGVWRMPVIRGWASRSDAEAEAYLVADNQLTTRGGWNNDNLAAVLSDLAEIDAELLNVTGFTEKDLADLLLDDEDDGHSMPDEGDADTDSEAEIWGVVVTCRDERQQTELLERFASEGLNVRALMGGA